MRPAPSIPAMPSTSPFFSSKLTSENFPLRVSPSTFMTTSSDTTRSVGRVLSSTSPNIILMTPLWSSSPTFFFPMNLPSRSTVTVSAISQISWSRWEM